MINNNNRVIIFSEFPGAPPGPTNDDKNEIIFRKVCEGAPNGSPPSLHLALSFL